MMRKMLIVALLAFPMLIKAQKSAVIDSFEARLSRATLPADKVDLLGKLSMSLMNSNIAESDKRAAEMVSIAEMSRDRKLMFKAQFVNGTRYSFIALNKEFLNKSLDYYKAALELAKKNDLDKESAEASLALAGVYTKVPDLDQSFSLTTKALSLATTLDNDSLKVASYLTFGNLYQTKKERLLALRNYLTALRIAEEKKIPNYTLLRTCYGSLSSFYADIKEYDKAIDFTQKGLDLLPKVNAENKNFLKVVDLYSLGNLYVGKKSFEMSERYYDSSIRLADSLKYPPLKMAGYDGLLNQYLQANQPAKALNFFNTRPDLKKFLNNFGFAHVVDDAYGVIYTELKLYDSAKIYFEKAAPGYEKTGTPASRMTYYVQYGNFLNQSGNPAASAAYFLKAKEIADQTANLEWQQMLAKQLDSVYMKMGDFKTAHVYTGQYLQYKDSLQKLGEEKDLLQVELADEQRRQERKAREEEEALERKHTVQYTGISIGIAIVFVLLVAMGIFRVSETTIRIMGFFAFIMLFEFIILLADNKIHHWTHGEPLPILGIKIVLIAMLLPLHHFLEHKVVHYLATRRLIIPTGRSIWASLTGRPRPEPRDAERKTVG